MLLCLKKHLFVNSQRCIPSKEAVIITNEFRTSKLHPLSFLELKDVKETDEEMKDIETDEEMKDVETDEEMKDVETDKDTTTQERLRDWLCQYV